MSVRCGYCHGRHTLEQVRACKEADAMSLLQKLRRKPELHPALAKAEANMAALREMRSIPVDRDLNLAGVARAREALRAGPPARRSA